MLNPNELGEGELGQEEVGQSVELGEILTRLKAMDRKGFSDKALEAIDKILGMESSMGNASSHAALYAELLSNLKVVESALERAHVSMGDAESTMSTIAMAANISAPILRIAEILSLYQALQNGEKITALLGAASGSVNIARSVTELMGHTVPGLNEALSALDLMTAIHERDSKKIAISLAVISLLVAGAVATQGAAVVPLAATAMALSIASSLSDVDDDLSAYSERYKDGKWKILCALTNRDAEYSKLQRIDVLEEDQQDEIRDYVETAQQVASLLEGKLPDSFVKDIQKVLEPELIGAGKEEYLAQLETAKICIDVAKLYFAKDAYEVSRAQLPDEAQRQHHVILPETDRVVSRILSIESIDAFKEFTKRHDCVAALKDLEGATNGNVHQLAELRDPSRRASVPKSEPQVSSRRSHVDSSISNPKKSGFFGHGSLGMFNGHRPSVKDKALVETPRAVVNPRKSM